MLPRSGCPGSLMTLSASCWAKTSRVSSKSALFSLVLGSNPVIAYIMVTEGLHGR